MKFKTTPLDTAKRIEFHKPQFVKAQLKVKNLMQADLIKAVDELSEVVVSNDERINSLRELLKGNISEAKKELYNNAIVKYENLSVLADKVSEIYLMLLDIYTYGTYCMLAKDEWDWRAFARHLYTILNEHPKTVNKQLNDILQILKADVDETYDLSRVVQAKKEFSSFINDNLSFAKQIRINVDAHFDGGFTKRLNLIIDLSYSKVVELYYAYNSKMHAFLQELRPALLRLRQSADNSCYSL
ncbi:hypothetical protein [Xylanibacter brevis]|uniref:hypothetical protein n=1 Tax=Xylanibacter brevis TaxID=83231 RepID=UPI00047FF147|nr:hypothetical protein [Xylanibacter brevis]